MPLLYSSSSIKTARLPPITLGGTNSCKGVASRRVPAKACVKGRVVHFSLALGFVPDGTDVSVCDSWTSSTVLCHFVIFYRGIP